MATLTHHQTSDSYDMYIYFTALNILPGLFVHPICLYDVINCGHMFCDDACD